MTDLALVETPAAVVDLGRARANAERVAGYCRRHGLRWRPHVKTHKSRDLARLQLEAGASGLTVATPHEAEVMATVSPDLLLAYPPVGPAKLRRILALPKAVSLTVGLDSEEVLRPLAEAARAKGRTVGVLVEIDVGMRRVGVRAPEQVAELAALARTLEGVRYRGVMFYPGHIRQPAEAQDAALEELSRLLEGLLDTLSRGGLDPEIVSGGSTPTMYRSHEVPGLTEIRPGTCIFNDRDVAMMGIAGWEDCAYTILATVVSTAVPGRAVVDAGSKALAKEPFRSVGEGFGVLLDRPDVVVTALSEEHGILDLGETEWRPSVGDRVRIVPNHVCVSVNLQDRLLVEGKAGVEAWPLEGRGRIA